MIPLTLSGHTAIVTGASTGLGAEIARKLAEAGAAVVVNYHTNKVAADTVVSEITRNGGKARAYMADITDQEAVVRMVQQGEEALGPIDIVVNNAGREEIVAPAEELKKEAYQTMVDKNLFGTIHTYQATLQTMKKKKWGRIITIATVALDKPTVGNCAYVAGKAAMVAFSRNLAIEVGSFGITVNTVAPDWMVTHRTEDTPREILSQFISEIPLGRQALPEDTANAVLFYASDLASFITGTYLPITGGRIIKT